MNEARRPNPTTDKDYTLISLNLACVLLLTASVTVWAGERKVEPASESQGSTAPAKPDPADLRVFWKDGFRITTADRAFKFKAGGRLMYDWTWVGEDNALEADVGDQMNGSETRRARLYISGLLYGEVDFKLQFDYAGGDADLKDAYVGLQNFPLGQIRAGHFKEPFGLEELTSSKNITFVERSLPTEAFSPSRNAGVMLFDAVWDERATWAAGIFRQTDGCGDMQDNGAHSVTGRVTALPWYQDKGSSLLHVGAAYSYRNNARGDTGDVARFRARPEAHLLDRFVDTGNFLSDTVQLFGLEAAWVNGPLSVQAEYIRARAEINSHANLDGYYVQASYFLTGESRKYKTANGTFGRVKPKANFSTKKDQKGAWEVALRYSNLDLVNNTVDGGELDDTTVGLNWYLNPNMRLMFNYIRADKQGAGRADIGVVRMQLDF